MTGILTEIGQKISGKLGEISYLSKLKGMNEKDLQNHERELGFWEQAQLILQQLARETQQELEYALSELVTLAMEGVFQDDAYEVEIDFVTRREKTEVDIWFSRDGHRIKPMEASGLGAVDVASAAFRISLWNLAQPRSRATLLLDEPFKHLKGPAENERVLQMMRLISEKLGLQLIMVSDERVSQEMIMENCDRLFEVSMVGGRSRVKVVK